ncbi:hypothetical protein NP493_95g08080 [Ridgeia piscesae]|uniref:Uncharacterized protein n=1 Tax=Ridgeia piscesae TaxID=27915 RepID=A0AAD9P816_RIDPI|nr:hypothetical protein NP493_95g08080 [Ridgeia piscesae]
MSLFQTRQGVKVIAESNSGNRVEHSLILPRKRRVGILVEHDCETGVSDAENFVFWHSRGVWLCRFYQSMSVSPADCCSVRRCQYIPMLMQDYDYVRPYVG